MNVLFISISPLPHISEHSISLDLIHEFRRNRHTVYIVCALAQNENAETHFAEEGGCKVLRVKIGNNKKANIIEKGITTVMLPYHYIAAIKKYYSNVKFDLVLYPTPPVSQVETVKFIKDRDGTKNYLLLRDIFPQNAVDIGMMRKTGIQGLIYKYFRKKEKELYAISDCIGCMSQANVDYLIKHNPEVNPKKVEVCPNCIEVEDKQISDKDREVLRRKYGIPLDKKVFVYGGNLGKPQGIPFLIKSLRKIKDETNAYFLIVGDGTEYNKLESYVMTEKPGNVKLMKRLPKEDYDHLIAACDVGLIFLDHRFTIPNFPSRILAYMQAALPVLACTDPNTDIGKVIIEGGFGWWCESNKVDDFCIAVQSALDDERKAGTNGLIYLKENYRCSNSYETIIEHFDPL